MDSNFWDKVDASELHDIVLENVQAMRGTGDDGPDGIYMRLVYRAMHELWLRTQKNATLSVPSR